MKAMNFSKGQFKVRGLYLDGQSWLVAKDVCKDLELNDVHQALSRLDDDEKRLLENTPSGTYDIRRRRGINQWLVNEPGFYRLVFASKTPLAREFQRWVCHEVLPSIRKTGEYHVSWKQARAEGKVVRRSLTDTIKIFVSYLKERGELDRPEGVWYIAFTKLENKILGIKDGRDKLSAQELKRLERGEELLCRMIEAGMAAGKSHHEIYEACKTNLAAWALLDDVNNLFGE